MTTMFETSVLGRTATALRRQRDGIAAMRGAVPPRRLLHAEVRELGIALTRPLQDVEEQWVNRIEDLRRRAESSNEKVAGKRDDRWTVGMVAKRGSKKRHHAVLLLKAIREFQPDYAVEMGTCVGISAAYQGAAMAINGVGRLVTLEGQPFLCDVARVNIAELGLADWVEVRQGTFDDTLGPALAEEVPSYGFIDGHHQEGPTLAYFEAFAAAARRRTLLILDDINWSDGMGNAWRRIRDDDRVIASVAVDRRVGFCLVDPSRTELKRH